MIKGKGGGKKQSGQASGSNYAAIDEAISIAKKYATQHFKTIAKENTPPSSSSNPSTNINSYTELVNIRHKIAERFRVRNEVLGYNEMAFFGNGSSYYVANDTLKAPGDFSFNVAKVIEWINYADSTVWPVVNATLKNEKTSAKLLQPVFKYLNDTLKDKTFLVGDRISLADISLCTSLYPISAKVKNNKDNYINVFRWFNTLLNHPHVLSVIS